MYDDSAIAQTDYDKSINGLSQTTLTLRSWEYNPTNHLMEVTIEREHTGTDAVEPTFTFEAKGKETKDIYPAKIVYESDDIMVIHIENIPSTYQDRKSTRLNSSHVAISYAVFCVKKKKRGVSDEHREGT